jgi:hypothetical protein
MVIPTADQLNRAHLRFEEREPRSLFYKAATELVRLALEGKTSVTLAQALAVLLQTWNASFYRFGRSDPRRRFDAAHFARIESVLRQHDQALRSFRSRRIHSVSDADAGLVKRVFHAFEAVMGPVGTAKSLHLLAPDFFPLWDRAIAAARPYRIAIGSFGTNAEKYWRFMCKVQEQCRRICWQGVKQPPLKALDEFNYWEYVLKPRSRRKQARS